MAIIKMNIDDQTNNVECSSCGETINSDNSHRFGVGFSHYTDIQTLDMKRSYNQVFNTLHSCTRSCALKAIRSRINDHEEKIPFGVYDQDIHNPDGIHTHDACIQNVEYNTVGMLAKANLPKTDAITGLSLENANDIYIPHVDDSTRGTHYQDILRKEYPTATIEQLTLGTATLKNAVKLAHAILDEIIRKDHQKEIDAQEAKNEH